MPLYGIPQFSVISPAINDIGNLLRVHISAVILDERACLMDQVIAEIILFPSEKYNWNKTLDSTRKPQSHLSGCHSAQHMSSSVFHSSSSHIGFVDNTSAITNCLPDFETPGQRFDSLFQACDVAARILPTPPLPLPTSHFTFGQSPASRGGACRLPATVNMTLVNKELWNQFNAICTEMIITKRGRRMFPQCIVSVTGLDPDTKYIMIMDIAPVDNSRYKWQDGRWEASGMGEPRLPERLYIHLDSPATGSHWMSKPISFHKVKLTNQTLDQQGHFILHSMHKYQPRFYVVQTNDAYSQRWSGWASFTFPETTFITVTAYQNDRITQLKIDTNPFAKGFRENGMNNRK
ncbi:T-box transcription factor TBX6-like [Protopterus annectens]|uniref:T-box transcription factor TBX6-like n=1 Tax=Protopterus annectens TaxID=7888 RepID=UPI001CFBD06D|nr:T-box transcription factor TBX6-like [Protopterus annectens]